MANDKSTKFYSSKQEHNIAEYLGWSVVPGSGARDFHPGDITSESWLGECKTHVGYTDKLVFHKSVWAKLENEAMSKMKKPALFIDDGFQIVERTWVLLPAKFSTLPTINIWSLGPSHVSGNLIYSSRRLIELLKPGQAVKVSWNDQGEFMVMNLTTFMHMVEGDI